MKYLKTQLSYAIYLLLVAFMSCNEQTEKYSYSEKVVIAKREYVREASSLVRSSTFYSIAFNDGTTKDVRFGAYSCVNIGDTIKFKLHARNDWNEMILDCN